MLLYLRFLEVYDTIRSLNKIPHEDSIFLERCHFSLSKLKRADIILLFIASILIMNFIFKITPTNTNLLVCHLQQILVVQWVKSFRIEETLCPSHKKKYHLKADICKKLGSKQIKLFLLLWHAVYTIIRTHTYTYTSHTTTKMSNKKIYFYLRFSPKLTL